MTESPPAPPPPDQGFTPVPTRARHDGWTPERQRRFLAALAQFGTVVAAARQVGMSVKSAHALRRRAGPDSAFVAGWDTALADAEVLAITWGMDRALVGEDVPIVRGERQVGTWRRFDDRVMIATLRAIASRDGRRPGKGTVPGARTRTEST